MFLCEHQNGLKITTSSWCCLIDSNIKKNIPCSSPKSLCTGCTLQMQENLPEFNGKLHEV